MPGVVRVTDILTNGGAVTGPGIATVLVNGLPVAVVGDSHTCPVATISPHSPVFVAGKTTVLAGGRPVLRAQIDVADCGSGAAVGSIDVVTP